MAMIMTKFVLVKPDGTKFEREHLCDTENLKWTARQYAEVNHGVCNVYQHGNKVYQFPEK